MRRTIPVAFKAYPPLLIVQPMPIIWHTSGFYASRLTDENEDPVAAPKLCEVVLP